MVYLVKVMVKGTPYGAMTNKDGDYNILALRGDTLVFSMVGMITLEVSINGRTRINVTLLEDRSRRVRTCLIKNNVIVSHERMVAIKEKYIGIVAV